MSIQYTAKSENSSPTEPLDFAAQMAAAELGRAWVPPTGRDFLDYENVEERDAAAQALAWKRRT